MEPSVNDFWVIFEEKTLPALTSLSVEETAKIALYVGMLNIFNIFDRIVSDETKTQIERQNALQNLHDDLFKQAGIVLKLKHFK